MSILLIFVLLLPITDIAPIQRASCDVAEINQADVGAFGRRQLILWRGCAVTDWHPLDGQPAMVALPEGGWLVGVKVGGQPGIVRVRRVVVTRTRTDPERDNCAIIRSEHRPHLFDQGVRELAR